MKVLIVDDNEELAYALSSVVEKVSECHARTAEDGCKGYAAYLEFKPDVVITDIEMPGRNGFELMKKIRNHDPGIRTIYMSGDPISFLSKIREEERNFPVAFLGKPFSLDVLACLLSEGAARAPIREAS